MGKASALARRNDFGLTPVQPLKPKDISDASLPAFHRAQILRVPQAMAVSQALSSINGRPMGNRILVLPLPPDDHFGSIIIPDNAKDDQCVGIVVRVGRGRYENGVLVPCEVVPGNYVVFSKYAARKVRVADIEVFQIVESDISFAAGDTCSPAPEK